MINRIIILPGEQQNENILQQEEREENESVDEYNTYQNTTTIQLDDKATETFPVIAIPKTILDSPYYKYCNYNKDVNYNSNVECMSGNSTTNDINVENKNQEQQEKEEEQKLRSLHSETTTTDIDNRCTMCYNTIPDIESMPCNQLMTTYIKCNCNSNNKCQYDDVAWSFLSNIFFLLGGIAYLLQSIWDCIVDDNYNNNDNDTTNNSQKLTISIILYRILDSVAPFIYVINSIVDTEWSIRSMKHSTTKNTATPDITNNNKAQIQTPKQQCRSSESILISESNKSRLLSSTTSVPEIVLSRSTTSTLSISSTVLCSDGEQEEVVVQDTIIDDEQQQQQQQQHSVHRRTIIAAITFGIAAMIAFIASFFTIDQYRIRLDTISDHVYVVSSIISLSGKRSRQWLTSSAGTITEKTSTPFLSNNDEIDKNNNVESTAIITTIIGQIVSLWNNSPFDCPEILNDLGDILFFIGCLIDAAMGDFLIHTSNTNATNSNNTTDDDGYDDSSTALGISVFSALLWFIDACLYIRADIIRSRQK